MTYEQHLEQLLKMIRLDRRLGLEVSQKDILEVERDARVLWRQERLADEEMLVILDHEASEPWRENARRNAAQRAAEEERDELTEAERCYQQSVISNTPPDELQRRAGDPSSIEVEAKRVAQAAAFRSKLIEKQTEPASLTVRFYELLSDRFREDPLLLVCKLAEKAFELNQPCAILVRDAAQAEALDERLWNFGEDAFVPHQVAGEEDDDECPVLILPPELNAPVRAATINLRNVVVAKFGKRLLELVPGDPDGKAKARMRFRHYRGLGLNPTFEKL